MKKEVVSIVKCSSYKKDLVKKALQKSLDNIGFKIKEGSKILIKPNLLAPQKDSNAITTNPLLLEELCKILKKYKCEIYIGDSSAHDTDLALKVCGINKLSKYAKIVNFEALPKKFFKLGKKKKLEKVPLTKLLFEVDLVINFAKMKTHSLTNATLCIKNLYGCIPGKLKEFYHSVLTNAEKFSKFLVNIHNQIQPQLNFIDGIVSLEGEGPGSSGNPKKTGILFAGTSAPAIDIIASKKMGFKPTDVLTNKFTKIKNKNIEIIGNAKDLNFDFKKPQLHVPSGVRFIYRFFKPKICFDNEKCIKCHLCGKKCPVNAITFPIDYPKWNSKKCVRCLCCIEVCPHKAISIKEPWIRKFIMKIVTKKRGL